MNPDKLGRIVWHDLFTRDVHASKAFYRGVADWHYVTEHATEFAWGNGKGDFVLALSGTEAGAGFVESPQGQYSGWIPYVEVADVDASAGLAKDLQGEVEKAPFEVPGVGRNCLLRDPLGALVGICLSRHAFPTPAKQFGAEFYLANADRFPADFYREMFSWSTQTAEDSGPGDLQILRQSEVVGVQVTTENLSDSGGMWVPGIRLQQFSESTNKVRDLEGSIVNLGPNALCDGNRVFVRDTNGALSCLIPCGSHQAAPGQ